MTRPDVTVVLFRPCLDEVERVSLLWKRLSSEVRRVRILCAGDSSHHDSARLAFSNPIFDLTLRFDNLGFASGHNLLLRLAFSDNAPLVLIANPDLDILAGAMTAATQEILLSNDDTLIGPILERLDESGSRTGLVDTRGIRWDRWGRHFDIDQSRPLNLPSSHEGSLRGISGACLFVAKSTYMRILNASGFFFDDFYLAYREDAELGVRAQLLGVTSRLIDTPGFAHVRSVRGPQRGKKLQDLLGVKNRFLLKYNLGPYRPGSALLGLVRDLVVVLASATIERTSLPGYLAARSIRRAASDRGRYARSSSLVSSDL